MSVDVGERWAFMEPWWVRLREIACSVRSVLLDPHIDKRCDGIYLYFGRVLEEAVLDEDKLVQLREAMELVSLLAYVDEAAWTKQVLPLSYLLWGVFSSDRASFFPPKFIVGFEGREFRTWIRRQAEKRAEQQANRSAQKIVSFLFTPLALDQRSSDYRECRQRLLDHVKSPLRRRECEDATVKVIFEASFHKNDLYEIVTKELSAVYRRQQQEEGCRVGPTLYVKAMDIDLSYNEEGGGRIEKYHIREMCSSAEDDNELRSIRCFSISSRDSVGFDALEPYSSGIYHRRHDGDAVRFMQRRLVHGNLLRICQLHFNQDTRCILISKERRSRVSIRSRAAVDGVRCLLSFLAQFFGEFDCEGPFSSSRCCRDR